MNRRHLLCSLLTASAASCQLGPVSTGTVPPQALSPETKQRLAKAGVSHGARVAAFAINRGNTFPSPNDTLLIKGTLNPDHTPANGATLSDEQVNQLLDATTVKDYPSIPAHCFHPHHGFAFYNTKGRIVADMTICFSCLGIRLEGIKGVNRPDYNTLSRLFRALGVPMR